MKKLTQFFKALSDETRLRILVLLTQGECCVCDLMDVLQLPQSTVSRHLAYLRHAGLVSDRRQGVWMFYQLEQSLRTFDIQSWNNILDQLLNQQSAKADLAKLQIYLAQKTDTDCA